MIKKNIPNFLTLLNLLSGCFALVNAFEGNLVLSAYFIGFSLVFDFMDGMTARLLNVKSEIGKQLDSLADLVSFGLVPGIILYKLLLISIESSILFSNAAFVGYIAFLIPLFSALRLAKFNIDESQTEIFIGLPTPANAILIASFPLILSYHADAYLREIILNTWLLLGITILQSFLLVCNIPIISFKFNSFKWKTNKVRYIFIGISLALIVSFHFISIPMIILLYVVISIFNK